MLRPMLWASAISGIFLFYGFYSWQPYVLDLLGKDYIWLLGVVQAASSAAGIAGNAIVSRVRRSGVHWRDSARVLEITAIANTALIAAIGVVGLVARAQGVLPAAIAIALWLGWGVIFGISMPVRMSYMNVHIASAERATVLSLDALFSDAGAAIGQPAFGWVSARTSIAAAWTLGAALRGHDGAAATGGRGGRRRLPEE